MCLVSSKLAKNKTTIMKTIIVTITTIFVSLAGFAEKAEAKSYHHPIGHSYVYISGYTSCGYPMYTKRVIVGYDCYHRPIYKYYKIPVSHGYKGCGTKVCYKPKPHKVHVGHSYRTGRSGVTIRGRHGSVSIRR